MAFIIYEDTIQKLEQDKNDITMDMNVDILYKNHLNKETKIELDSFVFDRHTGATTSRSDFAMEGAQVINECKELLIDKYRQMYNEFKFMMDKDEEEEKKKKKEKKATTTKRKLEEFEEMNTTKKKFKVKIVDF